MCAQESAFHLGHVPVDRHRQCASRAGVRLVTVGGDRSAVLERLRNNLSNLRISNIVGDKGLQGSDLGKLTLTGSGITALGAIIAIVAHGIVFDITGGLIALVGVSLVGVTLLFTRKRILRDFSQELEKSRNEFRDRLDQTITEIFNRLFLEIEHQLKEPLALLDDQATRVAALAGEAVCINEAAQQLC